MKIVHIFPFRRTIYNRHSLAFRSHLELYSIYEYFVHIMLTRQVGIPLVHSDALFWAHHKPQP